MKQLIKVFAINDENTSNRVEQEMIGSVKNKIRPQYALKGLIRFAQQVLKFDKEYFVKMKCFTNKLKFGINLLGTSTS